MRSGSSVSFRPLIFKRRHSVGIEADGDCAPWGNGDVPGGGGDESLPVAEFDEIFEDCSPVSALDQNAGKAKRSRLGMRTEVKNVSITFPTPRCL